ncbi:hypothetical protein NQZ79_g1260 [Umbelopsis isabellina]|nr:hypothetical protein NQZ79_g1260 [Umbelopsis isabellina]
MDSEKYQQEEGVSTVQHAESISDEPLSVDQPHLRRGLKARHIQMIALGGTIGTGLFVASGKAIATGGPAGSLLAYMTVGVLVFCVMMSLGEMAAYIPIAGSFGHFATRYVDSSMGFCVGWVYWANWAVGVAVELTGVAIIMEYWVSSINSVVWSIIALVIVASFNIFSVKGYGEVEYWFSFIKVITVVIFVIVGLCVDTGSVGGVNHGASNWHIPGAPFVDGFLGYFNCLIAAAFSFNGVEIVGITAGESANPHKTVPSAVKQVFVRIVLFYVLTILVIGLNIPYTDPRLLSASGTNVAVSPFTLVFQMAGAAWAADLMNAILLITMLSAANSGVYSSSRTLLALAEDGKAPRFLTFINRFGIPLWTILASCLIGCLAFLTSLFGSGVVFNWLTNLTSVAGLITWVIISITHVRFRQGFIAQGHSLKSLPYVAPFFPYCDIFSIVIGTIVIFGQGYKTFTTDPIDASGVIAAYIGLIFGIVLYVGHKIIRRPSFVKTSEMDFETGRLQKSIEDDTENDDLYDHNGNALPKWKRYWRKAINIIA